MPNEIMHTRNFKGILLFSNNIQHIYIYIVHLIWSTELCKIFHVILDIEPAHFVLDVHVFLNFAHCNFIAYSQVILYRHRWRELELQNLKIDC